MQEIMELLQRARELGEAIAGHALVRTYSAAQEAARADQQAQALLREYAQHMEHMHELEAARRPIEVADKHKLAELEARIAGHAVLKDLMRAQADYVELMNQINHAMSAPLNAAPAAPGAKA
jgi:cell fate (sporulation/competence/biofilm development) regulator YlbF (YheA/YmcA/DUF963 family)